MRRRLLLNLHEDFCETSDETRGQVKYGLHGTARTNSGLLRSRLAPIDQRGPHISPITVPNKPFRRPKQYGPHVGRITFPAQIGWAARRPQYPSDLTSMGLKQATLPFRSGSFMLGRQLEGLKLRRCLHHLLPPARTLGEDSELAGERRDRVSSRRTARRQGASDLYKKFCRIFSSTAKLAPNLQDLVGELKIMRSN